MLKMALKTTQLTSQPGNVFTNHSQEKSLVFFFFFLQDLQIGM